MIDLKKIPEEDKTPLVTELLHTIQGLLDNVQQLRDTFTSLKKTCRKLEVSFWDYLNDRISNTGEIQPLADIIRAKAQSG